MNDVPAIDEAHRRRRHKLWVAALIAVVALYAALTLAIVLSSPLDRLDSYLYHLHMVRRRTGGRLPLELYVLIGQGVPASTIAALYAIRRSIRTRSWTPWVMFAIALFLLNASVGAMKHATGRLGPKMTTVVHTVWQGGTIFPSGHAANAIVMYGLIAMIAPITHRRLVTTIAVVLSMTVGLGTVALNTHWITDVFGGWLAGALVLLVVPPLTRPVERLLTRAARHLRPTLLRWWHSTPFRPLGTPRPSAARSPRAAAVAPGAVVGASVSITPAEAGVPVGATAGAGVPVGATAHAGARDGVIVEATGADEVEPPRAVTATEQWVAADTSHAMATHPAVGRTDASEAESPRRTDGRSRAGRHPTPSAVPTTLGSRSQVRDRRHHSLTQGS